jgi:hypothetical protein
MARTVKETCCSVLNHHTKFSIALQVVLFPALLRTVICRVDKSVRK